jgi:hypothetical protein
MSTQSNTEHFWNSAHVRGKIKQSCEMRSFALMMMQMDRIRPVFTILIFLPSGPERNCATIRYEYLCNYVSPRRNVVRMKIIAVLAQIMHQVFRNQWNLQTSSVWFCLLKFVLESRIVLLSICFTLIVKSTSSPSWLFFRFTKYIESS